MILLPLGEENEHKVSEDFGLMPEWYSRAHEHYTKLRGIDVWLRVGDPHECHLGTSTVTKSRAHVEHAWIRDWVYVLLGLGRFAGSIRRIRSTGINGSRLELEHST